MGEVGGICRSNQSVGNGFAEMSILGCSIRVGLQRQVAGKKTPAK